MVHGTRPGDPACDSLWAPTVGATGSSTTEVHDPPVKGRVVRCRGALRVYCSYRLPVVYSVPFLAPCSADSFRNSIKIRIAAAVWESHERTYWVGVVTVSPGPSTDFLCAPIRLVPCRSRAVPWVAAKAGTSQAGVNEWYVAVTSCENYPSEGEVPLR